MHFMHLLSYKIFGNLLEVFELGTRRVGMFKQTSPNISIPFAGSEIKFGGNSTEEILPQKADAAQAISRNKCGHNPGSPKNYLRPQNHQKRPPYLERAISQTSNAYYFPKKLLTRLNFQDQQQKRSERREACCVVMQTLLHYLELETLTVGYFKNDGVFFHPDIDDIANIAGIKPMRVKRALWDLSRAGYIKVTAREKLASIREVCIQYFRDLKMDLSKLNLARSWKRKKAESNVKGSFNGLVKPIKKPLTQTHSIDQKKAMIRKTLEIHKQTGQPIESIYRKLISGD